MGKPRSRGFPAVGSLVQSVTANGGTTTAPSQRVMSPPCVVPCSSHANTNADIAAAARVYRKFGRRSRAELVRQFAQSD